MGEMSLKLVHNWGGRKKLGRGRNGRKEKGVSLFSIFQEVSYLCDRSKSRRSKTDR